MSETVRAALCRKTIPTYPPKPPPSSCRCSLKSALSGRLRAGLPAAYADGITDTRVDQEYEVYTLENEYLLAEVLPALRRQGAAGI